MVVPQGKLQRPYIKFNGEYQIQFRSFSEKQEIGPIISNIMDN